MYNHGVMLSVILPTYNEAPNIVALIQALSIELTDVEHELIVVDDDSPDGTWRLVEDERRAVRNLRLIRRTTRRSLTDALREGIRASRGDLVGWMDCDFSTPPLVMRQLAKTIGDDCDMAVASRYVAGGRDARSDSPLRRTLSRILSQLARGLLDPSFHDYTSGFVVARREILDAFPLTGDYGEYFIELIFHAKRAKRRIVEVPYVLVPRRGGESKTESGIFVKGAGYLTTIARLWAAKRANP